MDAASESGLRLVRPWRLLVAHDASASTCDLLLSELPYALGPGRADAPSSVDLTESSSVDDARLAVVSTAYDVVLVCLDLPPAPLGGVRLAEELVARGTAVVLVTRSLRWIPRSAVALEGMPWITPDATREDIALNIRGALARTRAAASTGSLIGVGVPDRRDARPRRALRPR